MTGRSSGRKAARAPQPPEKAKRLPIDPAAYVPEPPLVGRPPRAMGPGVMAVLFTVLGTAIGALVGAIQRHFGGSASPHLAVALELAVPALLGGGVGGLAAWVRVQRRLTRALVTSEEFRRRLTAVERNQALWVSLSAVLHDVRNPLHTITLLLETLAAPGSDIGTIQARALEQLALINQRVRRVMDQISELSGDVERRPIAVRDVVLEVAEMIAPMAAQAQIQFSAGPIDEGLQVVADRRLLVQAIDHLVLNSLNILKKMPPGSGRLGLRALRDAAGVQLLIQDNGPGLPDQVQERLFEPLAGQSRGGMGLGLAIAHALVQAAGGDLELAETGAQGTQFCLRLEAL